MVFPLPMRDGHIDEAYANAREEVTALVPRAARTILDVGCSVGIMGNALEARGCVVTGIEVSPELAAAARSRLTTVIEANVEELVRAGNGPVGPFDCVVMADVLEHLIDPWAVVAWAAERVSSEGSMVVSVPNIRHLQMAWNVVVRRRWPYRDVGIFDRTHLRWFARGNLPDLLQGTEFEITELSRSHRLRLVESRLNRLAPYLRDMGTLQFIFRAERRGGAA